MRNIIEVFVYNFVALRTTSQNSSKLFKKKSNVDPNTSAVPCLRTLTDPSYSRHLRFANLNYFLNSFLRHCRRLYWLLRVAQV